MHFRASQRTSSKNNSKQLSPRLLLAQPPHAKLHPLRPPQQLQELRRTTLATNPSIFSKRPHKQAVVAPVDVLNGKVPRPPQVSSGKVLERERERALVPVAKLAPAGSVILIFFEPIHSSNNCVR